MTQKSRASILTEIGTLLADNTTQDISPDDVRTVVQDINDSMMLNTSLTRAAMNTLISNTEVEVNSMYTITNAVSSTKVIIVFGKTTSTISTLALNLTDNTFGTYNISADYFIANSVSVKKSFTSAELLAGIDYTPPEYAAPGSGYYWDIESVIANYIYGTQPYDTIQINVRNENSGANLYTDNDTIANVSSNLFFALQKITNTASTYYKENEPINIQIPGSSQGDGTLTVYITAKLRAI